MADFLTGKALDEKLTDIIWNAKTELTIVSPFIWLDEYCKDIFRKKFKNTPEVEIIIVFGKNEGEAQRSLKPQDLEIFKEFSNIIIIYCKDLHAKYYANENEALLTSLNLLGKSMTDNVEYGISFTNGAVSSKLYNDSWNYTDELIRNNPCIYVKRPKYKKINLGFSTKYTESVVLADHTEALYKNRSYERQLYDTFPKKVFESDAKPSREEFTSQNKIPEKQNKPLYAHNEQRHGYCIRTGVTIPFNPRKPLSYDAYQSWAYFGNYDFPEKYCHSTGQWSDGRTSMGSPIL